MTKKTTLKGDLSREIKQRKKKHREDAQVIKTLEGMYATLYKS